MLKSGDTDVAHIEFTSRCNLRCVFCAASQPHYEGVDLSRDMLELVVEDLKRRKIKLVCVSGHGETTIYKDWHLYCNELIESGRLLHIISNFAKPLSSDELETLSRFHSVEISCDTARGFLCKVNGEPCLRLNDARNVALNSLPVSRVVSANAVC